MVIVVSFPCFVGRGGTAVVHVRENAPTPGGRLFDASQARRQTGNRRLGKGFGAF
jgi:hypothetical protein